MRRRVIRGLGQVSSIPNLPPPNDLQAQLTYGHTIFTAVQSAAQAIAGGNPNVQLMNDLKAAGIPLSNNITTSSQLGTIARVVTTVATLAATIGTAVATTIAGGSCAGPWGAAAGAVVAAFEAIVLRFTGGTDENVYFQLGEPTQGATQLYKLVKQWGQMSLDIGAGTGNPQGKSFYNYIAHKYPPNTTPSSQRADLWNEVVANIWAAKKQPTNGDPLGISGGIHGFNQSTPTEFAEVYFAFNYYQWGPCNNSGGSGEYYEPHSCVAWYGNQQQNRTGDNHAAGNVTSMKQLSDEDAYTALSQPIATEVLWNWYEPNNIQNVTNNQFFDPYEAGSQSMADRYNLWSADTAPILTAQGTLSAAQIMAYAEANRPSPMFYASDLYVVQQQAGSKGSNQLFGNCATMSGVATVCGLLAAGGDCLSVAQELLIQQFLLNLRDQAVPPLFQMLVEEYLAKAIQEQAQLQVQAQVQPTGISWPTVGIVVAAVGVTGLLGYSAYTKQSPITVLKGLKGRL